MATTITEHESAQVERANRTGKRPVVFVHGLWLLPSSWDRWARAFERAGYTALTPGWPDDPETVEDARAHPETFAGKTIGQVADHFEEIVRQLAIEPAIVGHSFGGLLTEILAGCRPRRSRSAPRRSAACCRCRSRRCARRGRCSATPRTATARCR